MEGGQVKAFEGIDAKKLGTVMKAYRKSMHLTQQKVADYIGIDRTTYSKYETGRKPEIDTIMKLSVLYDVPLDDFLGMFFSQTDEAPASSAPSPLVKAGAPSALASMTEKENLLLSDSEKRLIYYYRNSIRKYSIMERAKEIYEDDISIAQDSEL